MGFIYLKRNLEMIYVLRAQPFKKEKKLEGTILKV